MNYSKDYENIRTIIDEILGIDTQVGNNLKKAVKKYFELKPIDVKLVSPKVETNYRIKYTDSKLVAKIHKESEEALDRFSEKLIKENELLKKKGEWCGTSS